MDSHEKLSPEVDYPITAHAPTKYVLKAEFEFIFTTNPVAHFYHQLKLPTFGRMHLQFTTIGKEIQIRYQIIGEECQGSPLVIFLHEGLGSIPQWKGYPELFHAATGLQTLVYERYGYGLSTPLQEKRPFDYMDTEAAERLPLLLEALGFQNRKLILFGHSDGATIALLFAAKFPSMIHAVISVAAHVFVEQLSVDSVSILHNKFMLNPPLQARFERHHPGHAERMFTAFTNTLMSPEFQATWNIEQALTGICAPILVVQGDIDEYGTVEQVNSIMQNVSSSIKICEILPGIGHSPHLENPQLLTEKVLNFLKLVP